MRLRKWTANLVFVTLGAALLLPTPSTYAATLKPLVAGRRGVVAAGHPLVAEAGLRILEKGGNAVDAGVASVFAASVVEMMSFGAGGECPILIKLKNGPVVAINGDGIAPELATAEFYEHLRRDDPRAVGQATAAGAGGGIIPSFGPLSAIVPGAMDALLLALEKYGTKSLAEVIQPAIELAQGFPAQCQPGACPRARQPLAEKWPATAKVYMPDGRLPKEGEIFVQADLARTFQTLARVETENAGQGRSRRHRSGAQLFLPRTHCQAHQRFLQRSGLPAAGGGFRRPPRARGRTCYGDVSRRAGLQVRLLDAGTGDARKPQPARGV